MKAEHINPFLNAAINVIATMAQIEVKAGKPDLKRGNVTMGVVNGVIGLASKEHLGNMIVSFDEGCILGIVSKMLGEHFTVIGKDVLDAVGEITNMISGGAKRELNELGYLFEMALPVIITGKQVAIHQLLDGPTISIPFTTPFGTFQVEANLVERKIS